MDIYKIIETLQNIEHDEEEWYDKDGRPDEHGCYDAGGHYHPDREYDMDAGYDAYKEREWTEEGSMANAEKHPTGPKFTGYWKGTDKRTPGTHMVGGGMEECEKPMSLMDKLKARWEQTKQEKGIKEVVTPGGGAGVTPSPVDQQTQAKKIATTQQNLNKAKASGFNIGPSVQQATQTSLKTLDNPTAPPTQQDKKVGIGMSGDIEKFFATATPSQASQMATVMKQVKMGQK